MSRRSDTPSTTPNRGENMDRLLTVEEVADFLGVPVNTLYQWRHKGSGPVAFRVGRFLRYDAADVRQWLTDHAAVSHGLG